MHTLGVAEAAFEVLICEKRNVDDCRLLREVKNRTPYKITKINGAKKLNQEYFESISERTFLKKQ